MSREFLNSKHIRWVGNVPRGETASYYQAADVFLFPTLSDGFGLTQLEAQAWKLPLIASRFCGDVVRDGVNGIVLNDVSGEAIADAIRSLIAEPRLLVTMSQNSSVSDFGVDRFRNNLLAICSETDASSL